MVAAAEAPPALLEAATAKLPTVQQWANAWRVLHPARLLSSYAATAWRAP